HELRIERGPDALDQQLVAGGVAGGGQPVEGPQGVEVRGRVVVERDVRGGLRGAAGREDGKREGGTVPVPKNAAPCFLLVLCRHWGPASGGRHWTLVLRTGNAPVIVYDPRAQGGSPVPAIPSLRAG